MRSPFYYHDAKGKKKRKKSKYRVPGVSEHDNKVLATHDCRVGDVIDFMLALWVIRKADEIEGGLPPVLRAKMYAFIVVDLAGGFVPFFGDIFDAIYKANSRNAWLLEDYLAKKAVAEHEGPAHVIDDIELGITGPPHEAQQVHNPQKAQKHGK
ncbi:hypothetical protein SLS53_006772 [Cytospora paraplurivora]|uniref:Uncharacterized protein n=1 Tax=Cytospora paraplurivora TaxID=2898453 RepID=A0AAN9U521_9PEZI